MSSTSEDLSPSPKRFKRHFTPTEKIMIFNKYETLRKESSPKTSKNNLMKTIASSLGIHWISVFRTLKEINATGVASSPKKPPPRLTVFSSTDASTKNAIRKIIDQMVLRNENTTVDNILQEVNNSGIGPYKRATLYKLLQSIGFKSKRSRKSVYPRESTSEGVKCDEPTEGHVRDDLEFNSSIDGDDSTDEDPHTRTSSVAQKHDFGIKCSNCRLKITGFRYTCVQCVDVELCGACDARGAHADHYVLRIPGTRPKDEVNEILSRVRATVKVLTQPKDGVQLDEPEIRIKTENEEVIDDPLGAKIKGESLQPPEPNARPHASNVLEQPMLEIPIIKTEYFEESETTVGDGNNVLEFELPGTSTAPYAMRTRAPTNIRIKPDASDAPSVAKRPRVAPAATATSASTAPRTSLQHTSTTLDKTSSQPAGSAGAGPGGGGGARRGVFTVFSHAPVPPPKNSKPAEKNS